MGLLFEYRSTPHSQRKSSRSHCYCKNNTKWIYIYPYTTYFKCTVYQYSIAQFSFFLGISFLHIYNSWSRWSDFCRSSAGLTDMHVCHLCQAKHLSLVYHSSCLSDLSHMYFLTLNLCFLLCPLHNILHHLYRLAIVIFFKYLKQ